MPNRPVRAATIGEVTRVEQLTPHMIRIVVGGAGLTGLTAGACTDHYVKILFPRAGVAYPEPFDLAAIRETLPRDQQPLVRTYTVRRWRPEVPELWLDFVVHGDEGIAGPWAAAARVGDPVRFMGPGGGYAPNPAADWHLLAGDESALPAITAALAVLPADAVVRVVAEVESPTHEVDLPVPKDAQVTFVHRGGSGDAGRLLAAVRAVDWLPGQVQAFVHGEAAEVMHGIRPHLFGERGLSRDQVSISGYWRRGRTEEGFRAWKSELAAKETTPPAPAAPASPA
jgi:NADPH-dependent ferric siderophore reductase